MEAGISLLWYRTYIFHHGHRRSRPYDNSSLSKAMGDTAFAEIIMRIYRHYSYQSKRISISSCKPDKTGSRRQKRM